jgi:spore coat protein SA
MANPLVAIVLPGKFPVPAIKGGAIEALVNHIIDENEKKKKLNIVIFGQYCNEASLKEKSFKNSTFVHIRGFALYNTINYLFRVLKKLNIVKFHLDELIIILNIKIKGINKIVVEGDPRIVHAIRNSGIKIEIIFHVHANIFRNNNEYIRSALEKCDKIIVVSDFIKHQILGYSESYSNKIRVLYNCASYKFFEPKIKYFENAESIGDEVVLAFVGRIVKEKGVGELFKALDLLTDSIKYKLLIIGTADSNFADGQLKTVFYEYLLSISEKVNGHSKFLGYISNADLPDILGSVDILLVPSVGDEALPVSVIEGIVLGIPIIASDSGGIPELLRGNYGVIVERGGDFISKLADCIECLVKDKKLRLKMSNAAKTESSKYHPKVYYDEFNKCIL